MTTSDSHTAAHLFQTVAWAALTAIFAVYAISESSFGALVLAVLTLVQTWSAWSPVATGEQAEPLTLAPSQN